MRKKRKFGQSLENGPFAGLDNVKYGFGFWDGVPTAQRRSVQ